jgi:hypothetical protein
MYETHEPPTPQHGSEFYFHVEEVKPKKRRKKTDPRTFKVTQIPWNDINHTELMRLCYYNRGTDLRGEIELCRVLCRTLTREQLVGIIMGTEDISDLLNSPIHRARDAIVSWQQQNWRYIYSQIRCNLSCADCSDVCVMACYAENAHQFEERG